MEKILVVSNSEERGNLQVTLESLGFQLTRAGEKPAAIVASASDTDGARLSNVIRMSDDIVTGSGPYVAGLMNEVVSRVGLRMATLADLETIIEYNILNLRGTYEYPALILRSVDNPYAQIGKSLAQEIKNIRNELKLTMMIPIASTTLVNEDSMDGLSFRIKNHKEIIEAPQLSYDNDGKTFSKTDEYGLPIFDEDGSRSFYGLESGLSVLCIDRELDFDSEGGSFRGVGSAGRLIAVREDNEEAINQSF